MIAGSGVRRTKKEFHALLGKRPRTRGDSLRDGNYAGKFTSKSRQHQLVQALKDALEENTEGQDCWGCPQGLTASGVAVCMASKTCALGRADQLIVEDYSTAKLED